MHGTGTKTRARQKHYDRLIYYLQALKQFYLSGLGATSFTQKKGKGHSHRREWQTGSVDLYGVEPG